MQPPRPTVIAHGKLSSYVVPIQLASGPRPPPCRTVQPRSTLPSRSGLLSELWSASDAFSPPGEERNASPSEIRHSFTVAHTAIGFRPTIAWKASPTRTPPPICTSATFLKPRWSQDRGRCEPSNRNTMRDFSQSVSLQVRRDSLRLLHCCVGRCGKQVFESARGIACVINLAARAKNFHKKYIFTRPGASFRSAWSHYGDK